MKLVVRDAGITCEGSASHYDDVQTSTERYEMLRSIRCLCTGNDRYEKAIQSQVMLRTRASCNPFFLFPSKASGIMRYINTMKHLTTAS